MSNNLKTQLEAASPKALAPIFTDAKRGQYPLKFVDAMQVGGHAAYIKCQQADAKSINFILLNYDLKDGSWKQFGQDSDNLFFVDADPKSAANDKVIKNKAAEMADKYFSKEAIVDLYDALKNGDMMVAKNLLSKNSPVDPAALIKQYPLLSDNLGRSVYGLKVQSSGAAASLQIAGQNNTSLELTLNLVKEDGVWKILKAAVKH